MRTLFLNLASHSSQPDAGACIACIEDDRTAAVRFIDHRIDDALLLPELDLALGEAGWEMEEIERTRPNDPIVRIGRVACVTGPGGFTSLRMAVTLANVLSDQLQIPLAGVQGSEVYEGRLSDELPVTSDEKIQEGQTRHSKLDTRNSSFLWLHSTKKTQLFVRGFGAYAEKWPEPVLLSIDEFAPTPLPPPPRGEGGHTKEGIPWIGELLPEHEAAVTAAGGKKLPLLPLADALPALVAGLSYQNQSIEPWYGRGW